MEPPKGIEPLTYALRDSIWGCVGVSGGAPTCLLGAGECVGVNGCVPGLLPALMPESRGLTRTVSQTSGKYRDDKGSVPTMVGTMYNSASVPRRGESQVRPGWRVVGIPDLGVGDRDQGPDLLQPGFERVDALGHGAKHDEMVWDDAAG